MAAPNPTQRVIVIDDEEDSRFQVALALLESRSARLVGAAPNGMLGAELAELEQPDVVVLDLEMPVMDGFEALPLLRQVAPSARIVVRTNRDDDDARERALALGARCVIPKFLDPARLRETIERANRRMVPAELQAALLRRARFSEPRSPAVPQTR